MLKLSPLFLVLTLAGSAAWAQQRDESEVVLVASQDRQMSEAIRNARAGLDDFLQLAASPPSGTSGYKLKVMVRDGDYTEHFWVTPFQPTATGFSGTLANTPKTVKNVVAGQGIQFSRDDISDWGYMRGGRQVGSYTVCVLLKTMPPEQADYYRKNHGFDC